MWSVLLLAAVLVGQVTTAVADVVWEAVRPALPYPGANERNEPVDGSDRARWIVRRAGADERAGTADAASRTLVLEVLANPFNREAQATAVQDMAAIQREVVQAERQAQGELERALSQVRETGTPVTVRGVTLNDEGLAGERADAESRATIEVETARAAHVAQIDSAEAPAVRALDGDAARAMRTNARTSGEIWIAQIPARTVEPATAGGDTRAHYYPAQAIVYFGAAKPIIETAAPRAFRVRTMPRDGVDEVTAVIVRGARELVDAVVEKSDWSRLAAR